jgi:hypothetical protein
MFRKALGVSFLLGCISIAAPAAIAQEVIHALSGTVNAIDSGAKTITVITDDGSGGRFNDLTNSNAAIEFNKKIRAETTPADAFKNKGDRVIVFYYGGGGVRTAVALKDLGAGPFDKSSGSVVKFNKHSHLLTIKSSAGVTSSFHIGPETIAESDSGATTADQFDASNGEQVRIIAAKSDETKTALFVVQLTL